MIRLAQLLLVLSAVGLWIASRLTWVTIRSSDGLGQPRTSALSGATWSSALLPLAVLLLAAAVAGLAVRGWLLRAVAVLIAAVSLALGYLGISLVQMPDVSVRGADLAQVPVASLVGSARHLGGAAITIAAAVGALLAAVLLMRAAPTSHSTGKYATPAARRSAARAGDGAGAVSERGMWDALDEGRDPTEAADESETEGR